jgi:hypothetical protein
MLWPAKRAGGNPVANTSGTQAICPIAQRRGDGEERPAAAVKITGSQAGALQTAPLPRCPTIGRKLTTHKPVAPPPKWYGGKFNHTFHTLSTGCTLAGGQVSEVVTTARDDFHMKARNVRLGQVIWKLTPQHRLHLPDHIYTQAGPKGLGVNILDHWPAIQIQHQKWYYRTSPKDYWKYGPSNLISVKLTGNPAQKRSLKVTTTVNKVSISQRYSGPRVRIKSRRPTRRRP